MARAPRTTAKPSVVDQVVRTEEAEARLDDAVHAAFTTEAGKDTMLWLRSITIQSVLGPDNTAISLAYQEGMRRVVQLLQQRIDNHAKRQTSDE